jgi:predicted AAA+ superfamily ATPase
MQCRFGSSSKLLFQEIATSLQGRTLDYLMLPGEVIQKYFCIPKEEVEFIIKKGIKITTLIQSSFDLSDYQTKEREIKSLIRVSKELNYPHLLIIISNEEGEEIIKDKKIKYIPIWKWLLNSK